MVCIDYSKGAFGSQNDFRMNEICQRNWNGMFSGLTKCLVDSNGMESVK